MKPVEFYKNAQEQGVKLTISNTTAVRRIFYDYLTGIDTDTITYKYPLNNKDYQKYQKELQLIDQVLVDHDLLGKEECPYHNANILYFLIEFNNKYADLIRMKQRDARLYQWIDFLKLVKPLSSLQKQNVQMSFVINGEPFTFEDDPLLSEVVMNKLSGRMMNTICTVYPELWELYLKRGGDPKAVKEREKADSMLQNKAVAEITKTLIVYLNSKSTKLKNNKANEDKPTLTSKQGAFVFDLLTTLKIYNPRDKVKLETVGKEANYHGLRKLIERY